jgi:D-alanine transaminase
VSLLPNVLMREEARDASAAEAILIRDGMVTEGTATNVFVVEDEVVRTPPKSTQILGGVTRELVIELARAAGIDCREEPLGEAQLRAAREIWLSSSTKEVAPVVQLDGAPVGEGAPGPMWQRMHALFEDFKKRVMRGEVD